MPSVGPFGSASRPPTFLSSGRWARIILKNSIDLSEGHFWPVKLYRTTVAFLVLDAFFFLQGLITVSRIRSNPFGQDTPALISLHRSDQILSGSMFFGATIFGLLIAAQSKRFGFLAFAFFYCLFKFICSIAFLIWVIGALGTSFSNKVPFYLVGFGWNIFGLLLFGFLVGTVAFKNKQQEKWTAGERFLYSNTASLIKEETPSVFCHKCERQIPAMARCIYCGKDV